MYSYFFFFFVVRFYSDEVERGDEFIDKFIHDMMYEHGHEYDPYILEDSAVGFSKKVTFVNVSGEAKLHNGYITGLKSLHRPDHCSVRQENDRLYVNADLGAGILNMHYDGTVKFMNFGPTITVYGEVSYVEIHMEFSVDSKTGKNGNLEKFYIENMKGMKVWMSGLGPMNWALNYLISGVTSLFQGFVKKMIEKQVRSHIAERLPNYEFPVDGSNEIPETVAPETEAPDTVPPEPEEERLALVKKYLSSSNMVL